MAKSLLVVKVCEICLDFPSIASIMKWTLAKQVSLVKIRNIHAKFRFFQIIPKNIEETNITSKYTICDTMPYTVQMHLNLN